MSAAGKVVLASWGIGILGCVSLCQKIQGGTLKKSTLGEKIRLTSVKFCTLYKLQVTMIFFMFYNLCDVEIRGNHFIHVHLKHIFCIYIKKPEFQKFRGQDIMSQYIHFQ